MNFYGESKNLTETEFKRQKDAEKGWNAEKETKYLSSLVESYDKIIKSYDELSKLSDSVLKGTRKKGKDYTGNALSELVGRGDKHVDRGFDQYVEGLKWKRKAIENGWGSRDLQLMNLTGIFEGLVDHRIYDSELNGSVEYTVKLKEWKESVFMPIKEELWNKKIESPSDVLACLNIIEGIKDKLPNISAIEDAYNTTLQIGEDVLFKKCSNECISDVAKGESLYYGPEIQKDKIFEKKDSRLEKTAMLEQIKNSENYPQKAIEEMVAAYVYHEYLDGKNTVAHPELFDENNVYHKSVTSRLKKECNKYAHELIEGLKITSKTAEGEEIKTMPSGEELKGILETNIHGSAMSDMSDRIAAGMAYSRSEAFINAVPIGKKSGVSISDAVKTMKNAETITKNPLFGDVMKGLSALEKMRDSFVKTMKEEMAAGRAGIVPEKDFEDFKNKQKEIAAKISAYIKQKDELIRKAGGDPQNPDDIALLGKTGKKRYLAMQQAKKAFLSLRRVTNDFDNNGPLISDIVTHEHIDEGYKLDCDYLRQAAIREKFKAVDDKAREITRTEEKFRQDEAEKYYKLGKRREKELADGKLSPEEYEQVRAQDKAEYEEKIVSSAKRVLYNELLRASFTTQADNNMLDRASYKKSETVIKNYNTAVDDLMKEKNSTQFKKFDQEILDYGNPFMQSFAEEVIKSTEKMPLRTEELYKVRDNLIQKFIDNAPNKVMKDRYKMGAKVMGKGSCELNYEREKDIRRNPPKELDQDKKLGADKKPKQKIPEANAKSEQSKKGK